MEFKEGSIVVTKDGEYKLKGIISVPSFNHYCCVIFNPRGSYLNDNFQSNYINYRDGMLNNGKISMIKEGVVTNQGIFVHNGYSNHFS